MNSLIIGQTVILKDHYKGKEALILDHILYNGHTRYLAVFSDKSIEQVHVEQIIGIKPAGSSPKGSHIQS
jgi:hypothetical protein